MLTVNQNAATLQKFPRAMKTLKLKMKGEGTMVMRWQWWSVNNIVGYALRYMWVFIKAQVPTEDGYYMCLTDSNITQPNMDINRTLELKLCGTAAGIGDGREAWYHTHDRFQNFTRSHSIAHNWFHKEEDYSDKWVGLVKNSFNFSTSGIH